MPKIRSSAFQGADLAWLVTEREGALLFTSDTGKTWNKIQGGAVGGKFDAVSFIDRKQGWALNSQGQVWKSDDGGQSWIAISKLTATARDDWRFNSGVQVEVLDDRNAWILETMSIWRTEDGGINWRKVFSSDSTNTKGQPTWGSFLGSNTAWISGTSGEVYETNDAASTWRTQTLMTNGDFRDVYFLNEQTGWLVGYVGGETGTQLYRTEDGGKSWRKYLISDTSIESVYFFDSNQGWAAGSKAAPKGAKAPIQSVLLHTRDGGQSWNQVELRNEEPAFDDVHFTNAATGWLIGRNTIYRTADGGTSWQAILSLQVKTAK